MSDINENNVNPQENDEFFANESEIADLEENFMQVLTNDPSDPIPLEGYDVAIVLQRPSFRDKYKFRAWSSKKLKEFGFSDAEEEDPELAYFIRSWGAVNSHVVSLFYKDEANGSVKINGETFSEYVYKPEEDLDYTSVFEKYAIEEIYNKGKSEDMFIAAGIIAYTQWMEKFQFTGDDIKNS